MKTNTNTPTTKARKDFTSEELAVMKQAKKNLIVSLISKVKSLDEQDKINIFENEHIEKIDSSPLSERNTLLVYTQGQERGFKPTVIGGYKQWSNDVNRRVKKGEKGILIIIPQKQKDKPKQPFFAGKFVFDISQTEEIPLYDKSDYNLKNIGIISETGQMMENLPF
jgi:hypothetical protein